MTIPQLSQSHNDWRNPQLKPVKKEPQRFKSPIKAKSASSKRDFIKRALKVLLPIGLFLLLAGGVFFIALMAWISKDLPSPNGVLNREVTVSTKIYDRTGNVVLYDIHGDIKRTLVKFEDIPDFAKKAVLAAEDRNFYKHSGFSITGIIRSAVMNALTGSKVGGSTLTQQFVKNAILTNEKTYTRKLKEFFMAYQIERKFSKDQILLMYLNEIPYGSVIYGIEAASQSYFGKPAKDLTLAESAILAAIPKAPTYYSPYGSHKDKLIDRQRYILGSMAELGYVTKDEAERAKSEKIIFKPPRESITAPHFVMYIKDLLNEKYGEDFLNQEGLKVITSLDLDKQRIAEQAVTDGVKANGARYGFGNAALVALDPKTGQVLAMVGSADYFDNDIDGQVNVAISPRQPGSSFKPIVYTAAFIKGYTPNTVLYDVNTNFDVSGGQPYEPKDYDLRERGPITIRRALAGSLNIPAVKATYLTGVSNVLDLADKLGYTTLKDRSRFGLSLVLGGGEVKLLEHAGAYATLAQEGTKHEINPILKIEDKNGRVVYEFKDKTDKILEPEIARQTVDIMSDDNARAYVFGAGGKLTLPGRPVAAKTGTTNDYHDAWTMGFTPSLVCGVWVGNSDNAALKKGADGSIIAAPIWNQFMSESLKNTPVENFTKPQPISTGKPVLDGDTSINKSIKIDAMTGKPATDDTPADSIIMSTTTVVHDILYYVDKNDPRGAQPENPGRDPQFANWEASALRWAQANGYTPSNGENTNVIPTDTAGGPQVSIAAPLPGQTLKDISMTVKTSMMTSQSISQVSYYIDGKSLTSKDGAGDVTLNLSSLTSGFHKLRVIAKDSVGGTGSAEVEFNYISASPAPYISWSNPTRNTVLSSFPVTAKGELANGSSIKKIDFYYIGVNSELENFIGYTIPDSEDVSVLWRIKPKAGDYYFYANMFDANNKKTVSDKIKVTIK